MVIHRQFELSADWVDALKTESMSQMGRADLVGSDKCSLEFGMAVNDRGRCYVSGPGSVLNAYHNSEGKLQASLFSCTDADLLPTRTSYIYYKEEHYSFLHHDAASAHITLITGLSDKLSPLVLFPAFGRATQKDIEVLNRIPNLRGPEFVTQMHSLFGARGSSIEVPLAFGTTIALTGRAVAHARPAQSQPGTVATACYSFIQPPANYLL